MKTSTGAIWTQFSDRLRGFIARRVRGESDVEDVLQEVFARIHAGLGGLKEPRKLEAWLFQVARRAISDHFRSRSGRRRAVGVPDEVAERTPVQDVPAEVASWLEPMMSLLPEEDREALRLTNREGLSRKALAECLGLSVTGAKSRVQRAHLRLRDVVLDCCHIEMDRRGNVMDYKPRDNSCSCEGCR